MRASTALWRVRSWANRIPGAYAAFRYITLRFGEGKVYRIRTGPMRGLCWRRYNRLNFWYHLGLFEPQITRLIRDSLREGDCFWDIGANGGYHTLLAARTVGPAGHVLAVEANPDLIPLIQAQLQLNEVANCTVVGVAISDREGTARFAVDDNSLKSRLSDAKEMGEGQILEVATTTLDALARHHAPPNLLKIDVEGAEVQVLLGGAHLLSIGARPRLLVSTHGEYEGDQCKQLLDAHGYSVSSVPGFAQMLLAIPNDSSAASATWR